MNLPFAWFQQMPRRYRIILLALCVGMMFHLASMLRRTDRLGDFREHWLFGQRFLTGQPLYGEKYDCYNYMPVAGLYYAPLALFGDKTAFAVRYVLALAGLGLVLRWLWLMLPARRNPYLVIGLTLLLSFRYILRDLGDGGQHLLFLAILVGGAFAAFRGRDILSSGCFGLAIAVKITPALLFPYLLWKRQWRLACMTMAATALWIMLPVFWMGPAAWWQHQQQWNQVALRYFGGKLPTGFEDHIAENDLRIENQSLKSAVTHFFGSRALNHPLPPGKDPCLLVNLQPQYASLAACVAMFGLLAGFCFVIGGNRADPRQSSWAMEFAGLMLLMLLLSPVTWLQHLVWAVPAVFVILASDKPSCQSTVFRIGLGVFALITLVLNRELLGATVNSLLLAYHIHTIALLILLGLVLWLTAAAEPAIDFGDGLRGKVELKLHPGEAIRQASSHFDDSAGTGKTGFISAPRETPPNQRIPPG